MAAFAVARRNCLSDGGAESEHPLVTFVGVYASAKPGELCLMAAFAVARRNCLGEGGRRASIRCEGGFFVEALVGIALCVPATLLVWGRRSRDFGERRGAESEHPLE